MFVIITTLICVGLPLWYVIESVEQASVGKSLFNAAQVIAFVLLIQYIV